MISLKEILEKFSDSNRNDDDEGLGYDEYYNSDYVQGSTAPKRTLNDADYDFKSRKNRESIIRDNHKVTPIKKNSAVVGYNAQVKVFRPTKMSQCQDIVDTLMNGTVVLINQQGFENEALNQRIVDFVSGAVYSINGQMESIAKAIYIVTPSGVNIDGDLFNIASGSLEIPSLINR